MQKFIFVFFCLLHPGISAQSLWINAQNKWGIKDENETILVDAAFDYLLQMRDHLFIATQNGKKGVIDAAGRWIIPCMYFEISAWQPGVDLPPGLLLARNSENSQLGWGVIDYRNQVIIPFEYQNIRIPDPELFAVHLPRDTVVRFINRRLETLFALPGRQLELMRDSCQCYRLFPLNAPGLRLFDLQGRPLPPELVWTSDEVEIIRSGDAYGIRRKDGQVLLPPEYAQIRIYHRRLFEITGFQQEIGVIDDQGAWIIPLKRRRSIGFYNQILWVQDSLLQLYACNGQPLFPNTFIQVSKTQADARFPESGKNTLCLQNERQETALLLNGRLKHRFRKGNYQLAGEGHPTLWTLANTAQLLDSQDQPLLDTPFEEVLFTQNPDLFWARRGNRWGRLSVADRGNGFTPTFDQVTPVDHLYFIGAQKQGFGLLDPNLQPLGAQNYQRMRAPARAQAHAFLRLPDFDGTLLAVATRTDTPEGWLIGVNDRGKEYLCPPELLAERKVPPVVQESTPQASDTEEAPVQEDETTPASFPGGEAACMQMVYKNLRYPASARKKGIQGTVIVQVVVEKDGRLSNPVVIKGIQRDCDAEALRLVRQLPPFTPAQENGRAVRSIQDIKVTFRLE